MSAIRNVSHLISLLALRGEIIHTLDEAKAHSITQSYVPIYEGLRDNWGVVFNEELGLRDGLSSANARVSSIHLTLNALLSRTSKALLDLTRDNRAHPLYVAHFKKRSRSEFKRLPLDQKLDAMRGWIPELKASDVPALAAIGLDVEVAVAAMDMALEGRDRLLTQATFFRETGNRKKLFDKVNATRKQTYGELSKLPYETVGLPRSFADCFFRRESAEDERAPTLESIDATITRIEEELAEQQELRKSLEAALAKEGKDAERQAAKQAAMAELQKEQAAAAQKMAEVQAKIAALAA